MKVAPSQERNQVKKLGAVALANTASIAHCSLMYRGDAWVYGRLVKGRLVNGRLVKDGWSKDDWLSGRFDSSTDGLVKH